MLAFAIEPLAFDPVATQGPQAAFEALAGLARSYLKEMAASVNAAVAERERLSSHASEGRARVCRSGRSSKPSKSTSLNWDVLFEASSNVSGAVVKGVDLLGGQRDDGFLFLRFAAHTQDLPLHVHYDSDRFIIAIGGRGFFHVSPDSLESGPERRLRNVPCRDRDA